ncbi:hypothetical protein LPB260_14990 [Pseudomonas sp. LPB0260]|uniref:hypothetical protein n=1 Tax=Pseudomonas sp. LPB0260 TaxID=2614442 RepID=UPI0015C25A42|nr:hypothetical protein [Pseudomonas sp. LPB0260]QLC72096.1 hypothetical protein LPB260_00040 [Pseudomonas sp. LPB0260]QLC74874.1 hypothetical protein LPB260_14990 [Pseudomonas sp. LPB0260]
MTAEQQRHQQQLAFAASGAELEIGSAADCPLPLEQLVITDADSPWVRQHFSAGLTAEVYRIEAGDRHWTLKRARQRCKVQNVDGQTSFLNELQHRADIQRLKAGPGGFERFAALVDTQYASYRRGVLLSPWIAGKPVQDWTERRLLQLFDCLRALLLEGLFEWDLCPGNILDDGRIRLFDFGYMYRFDPLRHFNSNGTATPQFHGAERFETRHYFAHLMTLERQSETRALAALRLEKQITLDTYRQLQMDLAQRGASPVVLDWLAAICAGWQRALQGDLEDLYLEEAWRSHWLDLHDDLGGQTCTPLTLARIDWLESALHQRQADLRRLQVLETPGAGEDFREQLRLARQQASTWQVGG